AAAEAVHDALDGAAGDGAAILRCAVEIGALLDGVGEIALLLQAAQDGADGGLLEDTAGGVKLLAYLLRSGLALLPDHTQDGLLQFAEAGGVVILAVGFRVGMTLSATVHNATDGSTKGR